MKDLTRIPRPRGVTLKSKEGRTKEVYDNICQAFVRGLFPFGQTQLSIYKFASLYKVPVKVIESHVKDGLAHNLITDEGDLAGKLEAERLKLLSSNLFRIGNSDRLLNNFLTYLSGRVLDNPTAHPLLLKEMNSSITSQIKLTETGLKAIQMLNEALSTVDPEAVSVDEVLTREEILAEMASLKLNPEALARHLEGTPNITPLNLKLKTSEVASGNDSYNKFPEDVKEVAEIPEVVVMPR